MMEELILHPRTKKIINAIIERPPHGLIIDGPSGVGVSAAAKAIANELGSPAFVIYPKKKVKNEFVIDMREGNIIIDDIRQLYEQTRTKQPGKQVYILDTGERTMTHAAQNAFLKLLEEPRPNIHFIIATHQFDQLLPTIVSRSQRISLIPISAEQTASFIETFLINDVTKKARLAFVGRGRPALIKRLADDNSLYESRVEIMSNAKTLITGSPYEKLQIIQKYRDNRSDSVMLIDDMNHQLRIVLDSQPNQKIAKDIERHLETRQSLVAGGNIRLQLAADVLQ